MKISLLTFVHLSCAGLILSLGFHAMLLLRGDQAKEFERIPLLVLAFMFSFSGRTIIAHIGDLPLYIKIILSLILLYGLGYLFTSPFGSLDKLPADLHEIASYHQLIFLQSIMIGGYTLLCYYWLNIVSKTISRS